MAWLYVPGLADSNSASGSPWDGDTELWVTSSGKPTRRPASWRGWQTRPWIRLLSGTISRPSMADAGVDAWISSLRGSRVNRTPTPESSAATTTSEPSSPTSRASSRSASPRSSSSRTSPDSCRWPSLFGSGFEEWVSARLHRCFTPPRTPVRSRSESECFSFLPTPCARDGSTGANVLKDGKRVSVSGERHSIGLQDVVANLPAPCARDGQTRGVQPTKDGKRISRSGVPHAMQLPELVASLPAPRASDADKGGPNQRGSKGDLMLTSAIHSLPAPMAADGVVENHSNKRGEPGLSALVKQLPAPTAADAQASGSAGYSTASGRHSGTTLTDAVLGAASAGRRGRLNPLLSEWVMGWPIDWTDCERSATESYRSWLREHLGSSRADSSEGEVLSDDRGDDVVVDRSLL